MKWLPRRKRTWGLIVLVVALMYTAGGFWGVPLVARHVVLPRVSERLEGRVTVDRVRFNPFTLRLALEGLRVEDADAAPVARVPRLLADVQVASLWREGYVLRELTLEEPRASLVIGADGVMNVERLLGPWLNAPPPAEPTDPPRLRIEHVMIDRAELIFADESLEDRFEKRVTDATLELTGLDTHRDHENRGTFTAVTADGGRLDWEGHFSLFPLSSDGRVELTDVSLSSYAAYLRPFVRFRPVSGVTTVAVDYELATRASPPYARGELTRFSVTDLAIAPFDDTSRTPLRIASIAIDGARAAVLDRSLDSGLVSIDGFELTVHRDETGQIDLVTLLSPRDDRPAKPLAVARIAGAVWAHAPRQLVQAIRQIIELAESPWTVRLAGLDLSGTRWSLDDQGVGDPVETTLTDLELTVGEVSSEDRYTLPVQIGAMLNDAALTLDGEVHPLKGELVFGVRLSDLAISPYDAYIPADVARVRFADGRLSVDGEVIATVAQSKRADVRYAGDLRLHGFALTSLADASPVLTWGTLRLSGIEASLADAAVRLQSVALDEVAVTAGVENDGTLSLLALLPERPEAEAGAVPAVTDISLPVELALAVTIDRVEVRNSRANVFDRRYEPPFTLPITDANGIVTDVTTETGRRASIDLKARVAGAAPLSVTGTFVPLDPLADTDLSITVAGLPLEPFSAISGQYLGHPIESGALDLNTTARVSGQELTAENDLSFDRLYLGAATDSPDAIGAPIKLGLDLLRDRQEQIHIDVPVTGRLDRLELGWQHLVNQAIANTVGNVLASPFDFLASAFGGAEAEQLNLSRVTFEPGSAELSDEARRVLDVLAEAMAERPGLNLRILPGVDETADADVLRRLALRRAAARAQRATVAGDEAPREEAIDTDDQTSTEPDEDAEPAPAAYEMYVRQRFAELVATGKVDPVSLNGAPVEPVPEGSDPDVEYARPAGVNGDEDGDGNRDEPEDEPTPDQAPGEGEPSALALEQIEAAVLGAMTLDDSELVELARRRAEAVASYLTERAGIESRRIERGDAERAVDAGRGAAVMFELE